MNHRVDLWNGSNENEIMYCCMHFISVYPAYRGGPVVGFRLCSLCASAILGTIGCTVTGKLAACTYVEVAAALRSENRHEQKKLCFIHGAIVQKR